MAKNSNELEKYQKLAKKRRKGLSPFSYLNPDGGNVPLGIEFFNSAVSQSGPGDIGSAVESGDVGGMGEAIDFEKTEQDFKLYDSQQKMKDASNVSKAQSQVLIAKALMDSYQGGSEVDHYKSESGRDYIQEFLDSLSDLDRAIVDRNIYLLKIGEINFKLTKTVVPPHIHELRCTLKDGIARILFFHAKGKKIVLTNGFIKKTQETPESEKTLAVKRMKDYKRRFGGKHG